jgi:putative DNA primase/helicase
MVEEARRLEDLYQYTKRGWPLVPIHTYREGRCSCGDDKCKSPGKHPRTRRGLHEASTDPVQISRWAGLWPNTNWAIRTGPEARIFVLDVDDRHGGYDSLNKLVDEYGALPATLVARTGGGGQHWVFSYPDFAIKNRAAVRPGLDVRGTNGYVVVWPSIHPTGQQYEWANPFVTDIAAAPDWLLRIIQSKVSQVKKQDQPRDDGPIEIGQRNARLTSEAGKLRARGFKTEAILTALSTFNQKRCCPPVDDTELRQIVESVGRYAYHELTDVGNANEFKNRYGDISRYCPELNKWLVWHDGRWTVDSEGLVMRQIISITRDVRDKHIDNEAIRKWMNNSQNISRLRAAVKLAESSEGMIAHITEFDSDPYIFHAAEHGLRVTLSGVVVESPLPSHLNMKRAPVHYDPSAKAPRWELFLHETFREPALIDYVKRVMGYSLTGINNEHVFFLLYGTGANGKSTFMNTILRLMGDYARQASYVSFVTSQQDRVRNDLAALVDRRLACVAEIDGSRRLDMPLIKSIVGGDQLVVRFLFQEEFVFTPKFKLFMEINHRPNIDSQDEGTWRRVRLVPFKHRVPEADRDRHLDAKLVEELPGILNWALEGAVEWLHYGLKAPPEVLLATGSYRDDMDVVAMFLKDCTIEEPDGKVAEQMLYVAYRDWCMQVGERVPPLKAFRIKIEERDTPREGGYWLGFKMKPGGRGNSAYEF